MNSIAIKDRLISPAGREWIVDQIDEDAVALTCTSEELEGSQTKWFDMAELNAENWEWENLGPMPLACGRCGEEPEGVAFIGDVRYCHGDERRPLPVRLTIAAFNPCK